MITLSDSENGNYYLVWESPVTYLLSRRCNVLFALTEGNLPKELLLIYFWKKKFDCFIEYSVLMIRMFLQKQPKCSKLHVRVSSISGRMIRGIRSPFSVS